MIQENIIKYFILMWCIRCSIGLNSLLIPRRVNSNNCLQNYLERRFSLHDKYFVIHSRDLDDFVLYENLFGANSFVIINADYVSLRSDSRKTKLIPIVILHVSDYHEFRKVEDILYNAGNFHKSVSIIMIILKEAIPSLLDYLCTIRNKSDIEVTILLQENQEFYLVETYNQNYTTNNLCLINALTLQSFRFSKSLKGNKLKLAWMVGEPYIMPQRKRNLNPGVFLSLFTLIANITGIELVYNPRDNFIYDSEFRESGTYNQILDALYKGQVDIALGRIYINETYDYANYGPVFYEDCFIFVWRKPKKTLIYRNLLQPFSSNVWFALLAIFAVMNIIYQAIQKCTSLKRTDDNSSHNALDVFASSINISVPKLPKRTSKQLMFIFYVLFIMNIITMYQGKLSSLFTKPLTELSISNDEVMYANQIRMSLSWRTERILNIYYGIGDNAPLNEMTKISVYKDESDYVRNVANCQKHGTLTYHSVVDYLVAEQLHVDMYKSALTKYYCYLGTFLYRKSNKINTRLEFWIMEVISKGFPVKWLRDIKVENMNYTLMRLAPIDTNTPAVLTLRHYEEAILMLVLSELLCFSVFLLEFPAHYLQLRIELMEKYSKF